MQNSERGMGYAGGDFCRERSTAAHWRHRPQLGSGELVLGTKPPMVFSYAWLRMIWDSFRSYWTCAVGELGDG